MAIQAAGDEDPGKSRAARWLGVSFMTPNVGVCCRQSSERSGRQTGNTHVAHVRTINDLGFLSETFGFDAHMATLDMSGMFRNMKLGEG